MLRCIVSLSHLIHNKCRIVIAVHVDTILHILDLISSRKEICLRCDHCSAWEHDSSASSWSPFIMSRTSGYKVLDSDIFLSVIYLWQIGTDAKQKKVCHRQLMVHTEIDQIFSWSRLQIIILNCHKQILHLNVRRTKFWISMTFSCFLQYGRSLNIRIQRFAQCIQLIIPEFLIFCKTFLVACFCKVFFQYCLKVCQFLRIGCSIFIISI